MTADKECHFRDRKTDDILREFKEIIYSVLEDRELSRKEERVIREVASDSFRLLITASLNEYDTNTKAESNTSFSRITEVIVVVVSVLALLKSFNVF